MSLEVDPRRPVGLTGARSGSTRRRGMERPAPPTEPQSADDPVGQAGARFAGARGRRRSRAKVAAAVRAAASGTGPDTTPRRTAPATRDRAPLGQPAQRSSASVRPYVLTGGRTRSAVVLPMETMVSTVRSPRPGARLPRTHEHRAAVELCREPRSVAEAAALLGVPLGVAGVLLGDLADAGFLVVHRSAPADGPDLELLERVLVGLRRL